MLQKLIRFSLDNAALVLVTAALVLGITIYQVQRAPVDVFPELNAPTVVVLTEAPGFAADEVEQFVTFPIESSVNGLPGVRRVRSSSAIGLSLVWVEFDWGADIYTARYLVSERLTIANENMPEGVSPQITPVTSITGEIMLISLASAKGEDGEPVIDPLRLRSYGEFDLRNNLLSVPGVSQVVAIGGELPEYQVNVDQTRLRLHGLAIQDVVEAARKAHSTAGAGYLSDVSGLEIPLRQTGRVRGVEDIAGTPVRYEEGAPVTIGEVADVVMAGSPKRGTASEAGHPAVVLSIQKAPGTNTLELTRHIDEKLDQIEAGMPKGMLLNRHVMRQSDFIGRSLKQVTHVGRDAAIIVAVILALFLMNIRATIITLVTIPLSIAVALLTLQGRGATINVMTLGGLAIAIGEIVDDSIIDVENVFRRLRENMRLPKAQRLPLTDVIFHASNEIRSSIVFATIIIVMVFVPLLFLQGLEGRFFRPLGTMYITSILASLFVALTVTPALCKFLFRGEMKVKEHHDGLLVRVLKRVYEPAVRIAVRWRKTVLAGCMAIAGLFVAFAGTFGSSFLPEFNEGTFTVFLMAPPGTSLVESDRLARGVEERLSQVEGVRHVVRRTGRAERDEHAEPVSSSEMDVSVLPGYERHAVRREIDKILGAVPGITTMVGQPIEHRMSHVMSGTPAAVAISVFGEDLPTLRLIAKRIEGELKKLPGARDVNAQREVLISTLPIRYRPPDLARWGLTAVDAAEQVKTAVFGESVALVNKGVRLYDIVVRLAPDERKTIDQVRDLLLRGEGGALVRLDEVADIGVERASNLIARENAQRKAVISANVAEGHNLGHLVEAIRKRVDPIVAEYGYTVHYGGQFEAQQSASQTIYVMGSAVALLMLLLLGMALKSTRAALLVMVNLPLALIGGIAAVFLSESSAPLQQITALLGFGGTYQAPVISVASMVGFVTLFGIAVRNGILLVNHYRHLMELEGRTMEEAILLGSMERLVPILMTALTAALGLIPMAMAAGEPGSELLAPLGVVVLGGLITSTFLNLIVVPAGYSLVFRGNPRLPHLSEIEERVEATRTGDDNDEESSS
ncbi:MAG: efflux RND transporter permease subunit [Planctomycetes bacterium]|nr:efflux RND transporter permease subunit [Planctomycetota bacterium]MCB9828137.1 efflux RND transporter permease subunit [Planctomycetota bacterium]MCB9901515.1 efflux RND transporter permease subunit [Planctomycetota bacterium]